MKEMLIGAVLAFSLLFSSGSIFAGETGAVGVINSETESDAEGEIPTGMEIKKVGGINLMVPKGAKLYKRGGITVMEGASAYSARRLDTMEGRLDEIEKSINELKEKVDALQ